jgi:hypothetical protein
LINVEAEELTNAQDSEPLLQRSQFFLPGAMAHKVKGSMSKCLKHFKHLPVTGKEAARSPLRLLLRGRTTKPEEDIVESIENN